jgi:hypothetical protein
MVCQASDLARPGLLRPGGCRALAEKRLRSRRQIKAKLGRQDSARLHHAAKQTLAMSTARLALALREIEAEQHGHESRNLLCGRRLAEQ